MEAEKIAAKIAEEIRRLLTEKERVTAAIDGRCGSGKSTVAGLVQRELSCELFHMDDFFLRPEQRTEQRYREPGGNVDRERFLREVLIPLKGGKEFFYRPLICPQLVLGEPVRVRPCRVSLVEGTYSCHPELWESYDLHVFLTTGSETQLIRIRERNGERAEDFQKRWIPLEELYFTELRPWERCEMVFST